MREQVAGGVTATYALVLDRGDEAVSALSDWAASRQVCAAQVTAVGAFERAVVGWFDSAASDFRRIYVEQQCETLSLTGNIVLDASDDARGQPQPRLHAVLGLPDGTTRGGQLLEGVVSPTLEVIVREARLQDPDQDEACVVAGVRDGA